MTHTVFVNGVSPFGAYVPPPKLNKRGRERGRGKVLKLSRRQIEQARMEVEFGAKLKILAPRYLVSIETLRDAIKGLGPYKVLQ